MMLSQRRNNQNRRQHHLNPKVTVENSNPYANLSEDNEQQIDWDVTPVQPNTDDKAILNRRKSTGDINVTDNVSKRIDSMRKRSDSVRDQYMKKNLHIDTDNLETSNMSEMEVVDLARKKSLESGNPVIKSNVSIGNKNYDKNNWDFKPHHTRHNAEFDLPSKDQLEEDYSSEKPKTWSNVVEKSDLSNENENLLHELPYDYDKFDNNLGLKPKGWRRAFNSINFSNIKSKISDIGDKFGLSTANVNFDKIRPNVNLDSVKPNIDVNSIKQTISNNLKLDKLKPNLDKLTPNLDKLKPNIDTSNLNVDSIKTSLSDNFNTVKSNLTVDNIQNTVKNFNLNDNINNVKHIANPIPNMIIALVALLAISF